MFSLLLPICLIRASAVIVPSNFVKREALRFFPWLKRKLCVTYEAADGVFSKKVRVSKKPFILAFTSKNPKKNTQRLLEAYGRLKKDYPHLQLVVVGEGFKENVSDARLNGLYRSCKCLVYPSLYEGFGLPILEAFAAGAPVIASDIPVFREIAGSAAILVNPRNTQEMAGKIKKLLRDPSLVARLIKRGRKRARMFSWGACAKETLKVYERVAG